MAATAEHRLTLDPIGKCSNMNIMRYGINETTTPESNFPIRSNVKLSSAIAAILNFISEQKT
jgi:hypothetical protein